MRRKIFWFILCVLVLGIISSFYIISNRFFPNKYRNLINDLSVQHQIDPLLVAAIINVESSYRRQAVSNSGAHGLMQLMPVTAIEIAKRMDLLDQRLDLFDPATNITLGINHYQWLFKKFKDRKLALMAYNAGQQKVIDWQEQYPNMKTKDLLENVAYKETRTYVWKIEFIYFLLKLCCLGK